MVLSDGGRAERQRYRCTQVNGTRFLMLAFVPLRVRLPSAVYVPGSHFAMWALTLALRSGGNHDPFVLEVLYGQGYRRPGVFKQGHGHESIKWESLGSRS